MPEPTATFLPGRCSHLMRRDKPWLFGLSPCLFILQINLALQPQQQVFQGSRVPVRFSVPTKKPRTTPRPRDLLSGITKNLSCIKNDHEATGLTLNQNTTVSAVIHCTHIPTLQAHLFTGRNGSTDCHHIDQTSRLLGLAIGQGVAH